MPKAAEMTSNAGRKFPVEVLDRDEVTALVGAIGGNGVIAVRNRALVAVLVGSGLRVSEALALRPSDIKPDGSINVREGKAEPVKVGETLSVGI